MRINESNMMIYIRYEVTEKERDEALKKFLQRKAELGIGTPTLCFIIQRKIRAYKSKVMMIDGTPINTDAITSRDLLNFINGRRTSLNKLYVILAYLALVAYEANA